MNGVPTLVERHQDLFRAVKIPAGKSEVILEFEALSWENLKSAAKGILKRIEG